MNYLILGLLFLIIVLLYIYIRRYYQKGNYDKHIDIKASLLLAKEQNHRSRLHSSIIFELNEYNEQLRNVQIVSLKAENNKTTIKDFERLNFELGKELNNKISSVTVLISKQVKEDYLKNKGQVHVSGKLYFKNNIIKTFTKKIKIHLIDR